MEPNKPEDSFNRGMEELNEYADNVFRSDLRALRHKELIDKQVQATMNAQIAQLQSAQVQML